MNENIVTASLAPGRTSTTTRRLWQYDYGMVLRLENIQLPEEYEVHFSNSLSGSALTVIGDGEGAAIPDELLATGQEVHAWLYLHRSAEDGETVYHIIIPVFPRAAPGDGSPTPVEQSALTRAIAALNTAVQSAEDAADRAETASQAVQDMEDQLAQLDGKQPRIITGSAALSAVWNGNGPYTQTVTVTGATAGSKIDLQPTAAQLASLQAAGVTALVAENNSGTVTVYALGAAPAAAMTVQCVITEVTA